MKKRYLASDGPVGKDAVEKNVEALAGVEDGVDPLDRQGGARESKQPGETKEEGEEEGVSQGRNHPPSGARTPASSSPKVTIVVAVDSCGGFTCVRCRRQ